MKSSYKINNPSPAVVASFIVSFTALFVGLGLFIWWSFSFSTHTLAWLIFIFGSVLGSIKVRSGK